jgi:hypothetical protein
MPEIICQGLPEPPFYYDKQFKATITGVTRLKDGRYASRYRVAPGYCVRADGGITIKPKILPSKKKNVGKCGGTVENFVDKLPGAPGPVIETAHKKSYGIAKQVIRNRMRAMINMLRSCASRMRKPKLYFFTVTFLEGTPDSVCYQMLNTWLTELRQETKKRKQMLKSYLWVAERQKNGTIHFHIAIPHYMNAPKANRLMKNVILDLKNKNDSRLQHWTRAEIVKYNGVHITKNKQTKRPVNFAAGGKDRALANYLTKYITKNDTTMENLAWHCSRDWSALIVGMTFTREEMARFTLGRHYEKEPLEGTYAVFWRWAKYRPPEKFSQHLADINYELLRYVTGKTGEYLYQLN